MNAITVIAPLSTEQARTLTAEIRLHYQNAAQQMAAVRAKIRLMHERDGWRVLGYANFVEWVERELPIKQAQAYRLLNAAHLDELLELPEPLPEAHSRLLAALKTPEAKQQAYQQAQFIAKAENSPVLQRHIDTAVEMVKALRTSEKYAPVAQMVATGGITASQGAALTKALDQVPPHCLNSIFELIALYELRNAELIEPIAALVQRKLDKEDTSLILVSVLNGTLGGVPLRDATMTDYENERYKAQMQHIEDSNAEAVAAGKVLPIEVMIYPDKPALTVHALKMALTTLQFEALLAEMMKE